MYCFCCQFHLYIVTVFKEVLLKRGHQSFFSPHSPTSSSTRAPLNPSLPSQPSCPHLCMWVTTTFSCGPWQCRGSLCASWTNNRGAFNWRSANYHWPPARKRALAYLYHLGHSRYLWLSSELKAVSAPGMGWLLNVSECNQSERSLAANLAENLKPVLSWLMQLGNLSILRGIPAYENYSLYLAQRATKRSTRSEIHLILQSRVW